MRLASSQLSLFEAPRVARAAFVDPVLGLVTDEWVWIGILCDRNLIGFPRRMAESPLCERMWATGRATADARRARMEELAREGRVEFGTWRRIDGVGEWVFAHRDPNAEREWREIEKKHRGKGQGSCCVIRARRND